MNVCFADGSVHWIGDFIDHSVGNSATTMSVWDRLNLSNDGQPIDSSSY